MRTKHSRIKKPAPVFTGSGPAPSPTSGRGTTVKESLWRLHAALQKCTPQSTNHDLPKRRCDATLRQHRLRGQFAGFTAAFHEALGVQRAVFAGEMQAAYRFAHDATEA